MISNMILFGYTGMLGRYIYSYFKDSNINLIIVTNDEFRITKDTLQADIIRNILIKKGINSDTCIVNCIGLIPQRNTNNPHEYYYINSIFPHILWTICNEYGAQMIQPTTDCVYDGKIGKYIETDCHDETNHYGISKSLGEPLGCSIIRCSIIGRELYNKRSFLEFILNSNGHIQGWDNHLWNGITCLEYCKVIDRVIKGNLFWKGIRHIYSPTSLTKYQIACIIKGVFNIDTVINKISAERSCDKTLSSIYPLSYEMGIVELDVQINELKLFKLL